MTPAGSALSLIQTERAILDLKRHFEDSLTSNLRLHRVSAPMFVEADSGLQDNLNGTEKPVSFKIPAMGSKSYEIVHSLAKWKRLALARYGIAEGEGLYTDMNALRPDEPSISTALHSVYVDQWDWERIMTEADRNIDYLKSTVRAIYNCILATEHHICSRYNLPKLLASDISFIHSEELLDRYPDMTPKERENKICAELGAVFVIGIGGALKNGEAHDGRAPDYDDWTTQTNSGYRGLNGDILVYNQVLGSAFEVSSMGIRVSPDVLSEQLKVRGCEDRAQLPWHQMLLQGRLPQTIGGGIGQSRLSMLLLQKQHIGEVQVSAWPAADIGLFESRGARIL